MGVKETARSLSWAGPSRCDRLLTLRGRGRTIDMRGIEGALLRSPQCRPSWSGARTALRDALLLLKGEMHQRQRRPCASFVVKRVKRTSLRLLSRMRATTFMHVVVPPPDVPAPAGPASRIRRCLTRTFLLGGSEEHLADTSRSASRNPGFLPCLWRSFLPPDDSGTGVPTRRSHEG